MTNGFAGKILILHLDKETYETVPTSKYEEWIGGHGMAAALFWDYCEDKTITDPADPKNVCVLATSPIAGTPTPLGWRPCRNGGSWYAGVSYSLVYALEHGWTFRTDDEARWI